MTPTPGSRSLSPADGELLVRTYREGVAQKVGHDLILEATNWTATVEVDADGALIAVALRADPRSLTVRQGLHGAKPLTDSDRASIRDNIAKKVLGTQPITFDSTGIEGDERQLTVSGDLTLAGTTRPARISLAVDPQRRVAGTLALRQSEWGITPYRALMGALKVRDEVEISIDVTLPPA